MPPPRGPAPAGHLLASPSTSAAATAPAPSRIATPGVGEARLVLSLRVGSSALRPEGGVGTQRRVRGRSSSPHQATLTRASVPRSVDAPASAPRAGGPGGGVRLRQPVSRTAVRRGGGQRAVASSRSRPSQGAASGGKQATPWPGRGGGARGRASGRRVAITATTATASPPSRPRRGNEREGPPSPAGAASPPLRGPIDTFREKRRMSTASLRYTW